MRRHGWRNTIARDRSNSVATKHDADPLQPRLHWATIQAPSLSKRAP